MSCNAKGWVAGVIFWALGLFLIGPVKCSDGWDSPSIGKQGACSHHGGVNRLPQTIVLFLSVGFGFYTSSRCKDKAEKTLTTKRIEIINERNRTEKDSVDREASLVTEAIEEGRNVQFEYKAKNQKQFSKRVVRPEEIFGVKHRDNLSETYCFSGYCLKRKDKRTFAFKRIRNLEIL